MYSQWSRAYSYIGKRPVYIPSNVQASICPIQPGTNPLFESFHMTEMQKNVTLTGPLGSMTVAIPRGIEASIHKEEAYTDDPSMQSLLKIQKNDLIYAELSKYKKKFVRSMWGTVNSLLQNNIIGITEGHRVIIRLVGVGFKVTFATPISSSNERQAILLKVGYSHLIQLYIPDGIKIELPTPTKIVLTGINLQQVTQFAAKIRSKKPPEPYNGKGIFVGTETVIRKEGKKK